MLLYKSVDKFHESTFGRYMCTMHIRENVFQDYFPTNYEPPSSKKVTDVGIYGDGSYTL